MKGLGKKVWGQGLGGPGKGGLEGRAQEKGPRGIELQTGAWEGGPGRGFDNGHGRMGLERKTWEDGSGKQGLGNGCLGGKAC